MKKISIGANTYLYPLPTVLVGANVEGKPNYTTIAYCGIAQHNPPMFCFSCTANYTNKGIKETGTFSVNIPSEDMATITDYCGMVSGKDIDKGKFFTTFYGKLNNTPMIEECKVNLECKVVQTFELGSKSELIIGEIIETYTSEEYLTNGLPDISKINPIIFSMHDSNYWCLGEYLGKAWKIGNEHNK